MLVPDLKRPGGSNPDGSGAGRTAPLHSPHDRLQEATGLAQAIEDSLGNIKGICQQSLSEKPSDPRFLSVIVDGVTLEPGADTYTYDGEVSITFNGATCDKLETSTPQNPVRLDIRTASKL